jgi:thioesterase domain-containing protein
MRGVLSYRACLFEAATIERLIPQYMEILRQFMASPRSRLSAIRLSPIEQAQPERRQELSAPVTAQVGVTDQSRSGDAGRPGTLSMERRPAGRELRGDAAHSWFADDMLHGQHHGSELFCVVPLRVVDGGVPLFCVHPAGGHVFAYQNFAGHLDARWSIHGVISRATNDPELELSSLERMATHYASEICTVQREGPYHLLGWSMGGVLALSVAHCLERAGQQVAFVGLIDSFPGGPRSGGEDPLHGVLLVLGAMFTEVFDALPPEDKEQLRDELTRLPAAERLSRALEWCRSRGAPIGDVPMEHLHGRLRLAETHVRLLHDHTPPCIDAPLHVWWAREHQEQHPDWAAHTRARVHVEIVDGNHFTMVRPGRCEALIRSVNRQLDIADRKSQLGTSPRSVGHGEPVE